MRRRWYSLALFLAFVASSAAAQDFRDNCGEDSGNICFNGGDLYLNSGTMLATTAARLHMQSDGNLALYDETGRGRWAAGTFDYPGAFAVFQRDGSFGVYWNGRTLFSTGTGGRGAYLALRRDGNLVIYDFNNRPIWAAFPP